MKLTEQQVTIRSAFREAIIDFWHTDKVMMFNLPCEIARRTQLAVDDVIAEMDAIPSIGKYHQRTRINVWVAKYFNPVANALWDGKSKSQVLTVWGKTKRTQDSTPKIPMKDQKEHSKILKNHKKVAALAELHKNKPDRWGNTSWNIVK